MIDYQDLGRRAKAAPGYEERPGMLSLPDKHGRTFRLLAPRRWTQEAGPLLRCGPDVAESLPDLSDHATLWALVGVVMADGFALVPATAACSWAFVSDCQTVRGPSLAEIVVLALEDM